jgi:thiol-disulfide isomerase/thioredoxin
LTSTAADGNAPTTAPETDDEALSPEEQAVRPIVQLAQGGQFAKAIEAAEEAGKQDPKNRRLAQLLVELTQLLAREKLQAGDEAAGYAQFRASAGHARRMAKDFVPLAADERQLLAMVMYNDACAAAKEAKPEDAVASLKEMVDLGFSALSQVDEDKDFDGIREVEAYKEWRAGAEKQVGENLKKQAQEELAAHKPFAFDFTLADPAGKSHKLADLKGKIVLVDVWGTWCPPCRMEIPHLIAVHKKYAEQGVEVVGLNYEGGSAEEDGAKITEFVKEHGVTYPCLIGDEPTKDQIPDFEGFPTMLFIDRKGQVRLKHVGYTPQAGLEAVIESLLAEGKE